MKRNKSNQPYLSWPIWLTYLVLFGLAIPWYWPGDDRTLWLGMPAWVVVAIAGSAAISVFTAVLLCRPWPGESPSDEEGDGG